MGRSRKLTLTDWTAANNALDLQFGGVKSELAKRVKMSRTTVTDFFEQRPIGDKSFRKICLALRLNWEDVSSVERSSKPLKAKSSVPAQLDEDFIEQVRERCRQRIMEQHSRMRLLSGQEIGVDQLYVDVWLLEKPEHKHFDSAENILETFDIEKDRLALNKRLQRNPGFKVANSNPRLVILGKPGSGKTTFLKQLAIDWCESKFQPDKIAVLIELRQVQNSQRDIWSILGKELGLDDWHQFSEIKKEIDYLERVEVSKNREELEKRKKIIKNLEDQLTDFPLHCLLKEGRLLILMDGLDEIPADKLRRNIQAQVAQLFSEYSKDNRFILTCRTQIMDIIPHGFVSVEVADFSTEQVKQFVQNWFIANGQVKAEAYQKWELLRRETNNQIDFKELTATPVLLSLICVVLKDSGVIPKNKAKLYKKGISWLLNRWNNEKGIDDWEIGTEVYRQLSLEDKEDLLIEIAAQKFENPKNFVLFEQSDLVEQVTQKLRLDQSCEGVAVLKAIEAQHGLLIERADELWSFSHLTFQEHFTIQWLSQLPSHDLAEKIASQQWQQVVQQLVRSQQPADRLLRLIKQAIDQSITRESIIQTYLNLLGYIPRRLRRSENTASEGCC